LTAREHVAQLMAARRQQFEHIAAHDLPVHVNELALNDTTRRALDRLLADYGADRAGIGSLAPIS